MEVYYTKDLNATFKIKSLLYKDLILNSTGMSRK